MRTEVFVTRFSPDGNLIAAGCGDGAIRVYNSLNGKMMYSLNVAKDESGMPMTAIRFRPHTSASKTKNVLLAVNADGSVQHWHITSGKCLHKIEDTENQLYTVDYRRDARIFATAGKDYKVRIYDEATKVLTTTLCGGFGKITPGHSNRVFSLKFNPDDDNIIVSGGWDNTVQIWDLRVEQSVRSFYGPHICGDAVDVHNNMVLTGSWRPENQVEVWDLGSGQLIENVPWHQSSIHGKHCAIYAAQFSKRDNARFIGAGGSGANEAKIFDRKLNNKCIGTVTGLTRGVFSLDFDPCSSRVRQGVIIRLDCFLLHHNKRTNCITTNRQTTQTISTDGHRRWRRLSPRIRRG